MMRFLTNQEWTPLVGRLVYRASEYSFDFEPESHAEVASRVGNKGTTSILIGTLHLEIGVETGVALFVWGLHAHSSQWRRDRLPPIAPQSGSVKVMINEEPLMGVSLGLAEVGEWHTTYDSKTGWICISSDQTYQTNKHVEFADNIVAGIADEKLLSLWLHPILRDFDG